MRTQQLERMEADRDARARIVGEHPLPVGQVGQVGCRRRRLERERELDVLALDRLRPEGEPELPEQVAAAPPPVAGAAAHQRLELPGVERSPPREVADARERTSLFPLRDECRRVVLAHRAHVPEP